MHPLSSRDDASTARGAWNPRGFSAYRQFYPATPDFGALVRADASSDFIRCWDAVGSAHSSIGGRRAAARTFFVLVRGLFGQWIPGHFAAARQALEHACLRTIVVHSRAGGTVETNAALIGRDILARVPPDHRLVLLCHSKGGLDALAMLLRFPALRRRVAALVLCQTPRSACAVLESILLGHYRDCIGRSSQAAKEAMARATIRLCGARQGCLELTGERISRRIADIDAGGFALPLICVASWSIEPTAWLDSQHARLGQIRPGCAHDGLFYLEDLLWPLGEQVLLPRVDHSQPTVGGAGFDAGRLWLALAALAVERMEPSRD